MRQMRHIADTKNAFSATTTVSSVPFPDTISAHAVIHSETKPGHHVSPHTPPSILMPAQADPIQRRDKCHRHQLRKRELCVIPLTKAKLTRSCAGPNPSAITYIQFTTGIALEETERCKGLALEHHKLAQNADLRGRNVGSHPRPPAKRQGTREKATPAPGPVRGKVIHGALTFHMQ